MVNRILTVGDDFTLDPKVKTGDANLPERLSSTALSATIAAMVAPSVIEDTSNPGLYNIANNAAIIEDPSTPGLYSIGA